jgi:dolichyl-diphosphooligosaccharide--protein glycosyltransferase
LHSWFNFRTTRYLVEEGFYAFHNWFDDATWYPLGRFIGGTVYPGLMYTAGILYHILHLLHFTVDIRNVCVLLAPFMAALTCIATYLLTKEVWNGSAGIFAAAFIAIAPGYISRSVAGSYDNEAVAIFALIFCFYLWIKAVKTGSMMWGSFAALGYFYMVAAWGGYIFIINLIPAHVLILLLIGRYTHRLYIAYCTFYLLGTLLSMNVSFVGFQPVSSPEHLAAFGVFGLLQLYNAFFFFQSMVPAADLKIVGRWIMLFTLISTGVLIVLAVSGTIPFLTGRLYSLLGATSNIAIVKSVSEHQPSPWTTFFFDLHALVFLVPVGIYFCFEELNDANSFAILYVLFASYFASIMVSRSLSRSGFRVILRSNTDSAFICVPIFLPPRQVRLVLVLTPAACVCAAIGTSVTFQNYMDVLCAGSPKKLAESGSSTGTAQSSKGVVVRTPRVSKPVAALVIVALTLLFGFYTIHCNWVTSTAYSSPSIVLQANAGDGSLIIFDDFREAYSWLRHNTPRDAKILSWWDYGYQITGMGNRTVIVDNNTRNNTHIATVGLCMASSEERAYPIIRALDVEYLLVIFGGKVGYSSDDINKFLWMSVEETAPQKRCVSIEPLADLACASCVLSAGFVSLVVSSRRWWRRTTSTRRASTAWTTACRRACPSR